ncbi:hypothetical protein V8B55DRAFT_1000774 [Mucor lusitanicus]|uniref:Reverse transcriptase domain-containing protein n=1 Tax=Mucor circinelloides f. lusitanicus TaxID=29924 RepID=A0A8H4BQ39_MUCCL|nr:hypothetical protein FB192DRAFT_1000605 [Mucor lusitanicus]
MLIIIKQLVFTFEHSNHKSLLKKSLKLHALNIGIDWSSHYWYIKSINGVIPLDVHYVKNQKRVGIDSDDDDHPMEADISNISADEEYLDQDASEEEYLIMEASDDEREPSLPLYGPEEDPTNLLGRLVENMRGQDNINAKDKEDLIKLITEFKDCFGTDYKHMQTTNLLKFHVDTGNHKPIYKTPYGFLSFSEKETLKKDLEDMVANGIQVPSTHVPDNSKSGGWSFPCRYVPKKGVRSV